MAAVETTAWVDAEMYRDGCRIRVLGEGSASFVVFEAVPGAVKLFVHDPEVLFRLAHFATEARDMLCGALAGQNRLPFDDEEAA